METMANDYTPDSISSSLITTSAITALTFGTGTSIYTNLQPLLESTNHELIIVTCFWARSPSLEILHKALISLSAKALSLNRTIKVRICFSSLSLFQKLFHTSDPKGQIYPPSQWNSRLGLPAPAELRGLSLEVKSLFFRPFSVIHPKFIIVDREKAVLPSCNVSWEDWFECAVELRGPIVAKFVGFWREYWVGDADRETGDDHIQRVAHRQVDGFDACSTSCSMGTGDRQPGGILPRSLLLDVRDIKSIFLPSPHHVNPQFRFLPWREAAAPPPTPLNTFLLSLFRTVKRTLYIQTPNLTSTPVLKALLDTLKRGIDVNVVTSERLMILEQLVTGGTTTARCIRTLIKRYEQAGKNREPSFAQPERLVEEGRAAAMGRLKIEYYHAREDSTTTPHQAKAAAEPVQSHVKLTIADDGLVVLGSGNLDRASWYTSQELGVAFHSPELARQIHMSLTQILQGRKKLVYDS